MGVDYTVSYQNNVNVGVATVVIAGMGDYTGTRLAFFDIVLPARTKIRMSRPATLAALETQAAMKPPAKRNKTGWWWIQPARPCPIRTPLWKCWTRKRAR